MKLKKEYFQWLCRFVCDDRYSRSTTHGRLLAQLHETPFTNPLIQRDVNREMDGIQLRYRFGEESCLPERTIEQEFEGVPCSVLEMMLALSLRSEETIMDDPASGNRTGQWFWAMIVSLGLGGMTDDKFDRRVVSHAMARLLHRTYKPNGEGGLFTLQCPRRDLRQVEIWYQAMWYLSENNKE